MKLRQVIGMGAIGLLVAGSVYAVPVIEGTDGDDTIVVKARGGEPPIQQDYVNGTDGPNGEPARRDPDGEINPETRTFFNSYRNKVITVKGYGGADDFVIQTYIHAKPAIVEAHVDGGVIDWNGVAGENNLAHDHWVEYFERVRIKDFSLEEGDTLTVRGHTVSLAKLVHDGAHTVIYVRSQQGDGGGAHDEDKLGVITVQNQHLTDADITFVTENVGIVDTLAEYYDLIESY